MVCLVDSSDEEELLQLIQAPPPRKRNGRGQSSAGSWGVFGFGRLLRRENRGIPVARTSMKERKEPNEGPNGHELDHRFCLLLSLLATRHWRSPTTQKRRRRRRRGRREAASPKYVLCPLPICYRLFHGLAAPSRPPCFFFFLKSTFVHQSLLPFPLRTCLCYCSCCW